MIILEKEELASMGVDIDEAKKTKSPFAKKVDENAKATAELAKAIKQLASKPVAANVAQDLTPIVEAIHSIQETQLNVLQLLEKKIETSKPKSFDFTIARNKQGSIHKIIAKETT